jgi:hypothetical protein
MQEHADEKGSAMAMSNEAGQHVSARPFGIAICMS